MKLFALTAVLLAALATAVAPAVAPAVTPATAPADPTPPRIVDLRLELEGGRALVSFRLAGALDERLERRIDSGLLSGFVYRFELVRSRKRWFDKKVASTTLEVVAKYNAVTREYLIHYHLEGNLIRSLVVRDRDEMRRALTVFEEFPAFNLEPLPAGQRSAGPRLRLRLRAELGTHTFLFFIPRATHTEWAESAKFRLDGDRG